MKKTNLVATLLTSILAFSAMSAAMAQDNAPLKNEDKEKAPVILLVSPTFAGNKSLADGCWARLYDGINLRGEVLTLAGTIAIPTARVGPNYVWNLKIDSVSVGPKATLTVWGEQHFKGPSATFKPGQEVSVLGEHFKQAPKIQSLTIECSK